MKKRLWNPIKTQSRGKRRREKKGIDGIGAVASTLGQALSKSSIINVYVFLPVKLFENLLQRVWTPGYSSSHTKIY